MRYFGHKRVTASILFVGFLATIVAITVALLPGRTTRLAVTSSTNEGPAPATAYSNNGSSSPSLSSTQPPTTVPVAPALVATVKAAFENAATLNQAAFVPARPLAEVNSLLSAIGPVPGRIGTSTDELQAMAVSAQTQLQQTFAGSALSMELSNLKTALHNEAVPGYALIGAGVKDVSYTSLSMTSPTTVEIKANVTIWARQIAQPTINAPLEISTPTNVLEVDAVLSQTGASWSTSSYQWEFAPGEGP